MSLLSTDITKVKRLSLREVKLPTTERRVEPITPILVEKPPTDEEIAYSKLVAINPLLEELVESLDLVSIDTGERVKKVELTEVKVETIKTISNLKIEDLIKDIIGLQSHRTKAELTTKLMEEITITEDRAETGIALALKNGAIKVMTVNNIDRYYLSGSTPF